MRLTKADIENGNMESAEKRMNYRDGGSARHRQNLESIETRLDL